jgi:hypothetical protein
MVRLLTWIVRGTSPPAGVRAFLLAEHLYVLSLIGIDIDV